MNIISFGLGKFNSMACFVNPQKKEQRTQIVESERSISDRTRPSRVAAQGRRKEGGEDFGVRDC